MFGVNSTIGAAVARALHQQFKVTGASYDVNSQISKDLVSEGQCRCFSSLKWHKVAIVLSRYRILSQEVMHCNIYRVVLYQQHLIVGFIITDIGIDVVAVRADDKTSLDQALSGAHACFVLTTSNLSDPNSHQEEVFPYK